MQETAGDPPFIEREVGGLTPNAIGEMVERSTWAFVPWESGHGFISWFLK